MGADEADARGVEQQADGHASFIARGAAHPGFYSIHSNVPERASVEICSHASGLCSNHTAELPFRASLPDEGCVLWSDEHKQTHSDKLLRCEQHVLVVPRYVFLKLSGPKFLVCGAETKNKIKLHVTIQSSKEKKKKKLSINKKMSSIQQNLME